MGFDASSIRPKRLSDGRDARVLALAEQLHERGITASLADAKRLAEGMVDTERKILSSGKKEEDVSALRERLQREDPLFRAVGVAGEGSLRVSEDFAKFVERAADLGSVPRSYDAPSPAPVTYGREERKEVPEVHSRGPQITFAEAPDLAELFKSSETEVAVSEDAVAVRHAEREGSVERVSETLVAKMPEERPAKDVVPEEEPAVPEEPAAPDEEEDLAKKHGIDLFDIFKTG